MAHRRVPVRLCCSSRERCIELCAIEQPIVVPVDPIEVVEASAIMWVLGSSVVRCVGVRSNDWITTGITTWIASGLLSKRSERSKAIRVLVMPSKAVQVSGHGLVSESDKSSCATLSLVSVDYQASFHGAGNPVGNGQERGRLA